LRPQNDQAAQAFLFRPAGNIQRFNDQLSPRFATQLANAGGRFRQSKAAGDQVSKDIGSEFLVLFIPVLLFTEPGGSVQFLLETPFQGGHFLEVKPQAGEPAGAGIGDTCHQAQQKNQGRANAQEVIQGGTPLLFRAKV
jgi:hypothetical protein